METVKCLCADARPVSLCLRAYLSYTVCVFRSLEGALEARHYRTATQHKLSPSHNELSPRFRPRQVESIGHSQWGPQTQIPPLLSSRQRTLTGSCWSEVEEMCAACKWAREATLSLGTPV